VVVVAPDAEKSAVGHAITIVDPLRATRIERENGFWGYAVNGTPADCVKLAYFALLDRRPDAVVSGINLGSNTGINVIYSGTVSAATEANILGMPSFAISLATYEKPNFKPAANFAVKLLPLVIKNDFPARTFLNVNVPNVPEEQIRGVVVTNQGMAMYDDNYDTRKDPRNRTYYWLTGTKINTNEGIETDDGAIARNYISITPLQYDLTNYAFLDRLRQWKLEF